MIQQVADHEAQDRATRERIGSSLGETLFVEAGAGTGKTTALVDRVVALVFGGTAIERIVAITFTERAAAELRDRVRAGLEAARKQRPEDAAAIEQALASLDRAQISTIHSFCQGLLYSFAAEAGIDPSFRVQDEVMAERRFQERWRALPGEPGRRRSCWSRDRSRPWTRSLDLAYGNAGGGADQAPRSIGAA